MTDFSARTTSNIIEINNKRAVKNLINKYTFDDANPTILDEGLIIYGYSWFTAERTMCIDENAGELEEEEKTYESEDMTEEFLDKLKNFIPIGIILEIYEIGGEGLRFPFSACKIKVSNSEVIFEIL